MQVLIDTEAPCILGGLRSISGRSLQLLIHDPRGKAHAVFQAPLRETCAGSIHTHDGSDVWTRERPCATYAFANCEWCSNRDTYSNDVCRADRHNNCRADQHNNCRTDRHKNRRTDRHAGRDEDWDTGCLTDRDACPDFSPDSLGSAYASSNADLAGDTNSGTNNCSDSGSKTNAGKGGAAYRTGSPTAEFWVGGNSGESDQAFDPPQHHHLIGERRRIAG